MSGIAGRTAFNLHEDILMIGGLDAMALAIFAFESGHLTPIVPALKNNNPGNLEIPGSVRDARGKTIFPDFQSGYAALLRELRSKFTGANEHGITPASTVLQLFNVYAPPSDNNPTNKYADFVAQWISAAMGKTFTPASQLQDIWRSPLTVTDAEVGM